MSSTHLTRKEIKRDEVAAAVGRSVDYAQSHGRTIGIGIGAAVLVLLVLLGFWGFRASQRGKASAALGEALQLASAPIQATGATPDDPDTPSFATPEARRARAKKAFENVRETFRFSAAAEVASVYLGQIAAEEGKLDEARKLWEDYVDDHPDDMLAGNVKLNLIELDRRAGKTDAIIASLEKMLDASDGPLPKDAILYELATAYESAKRETEAKKTYQRILDEYPQSGYHTLAQQKVGGAGAGAPLGLSPG
ncbi:MAG TPA: tetratricopeptide repeat protein [Thermoanaerobaculia bacterium]|nr:tetratricopeptide repeat protein [Thermoanaerobaculia bacterium]